jgi:hypothetical protein
MTEASRKKALHRRALRLEWFTVFWNVIEAGVAIVAGVIAGSTALVAFGADSLIEVTSAVGLLWRLYRARAGASAEEHSAAERKALYVVIDFDFFFKVGLLSVVAHGSYYIRMPDYLITNVALKVDHDVVIVSQKMVVFETDRHIEFLIMYYLFSILFYD